MRGGVCHLIKAMSIANLDFKTADGSGSLLKYFFEQLLENFKHPNAEIQEEATKAFEAFCANYMSHESLDLTNPVVIEI